MISYEWVVETLEGEERDIVDIHHFDTRADAEKCADELRAQGKTVDVGMVRDTWDDEGQGLKGRQWAYLEHGKLPEKFDGGVTVPKREKGA